VAEVGKHCDKPTARARHEGVLLAGKLIMQLSLPCKGGSPD